MNRRLEVNIDEIVFTNVDGLLRGDGPRLGRAFRRELSILLEQHPLQVEGSVDLGRSQAVSRLRSHPSPDRLGRDLARAVHQHLSDIPPGSSACVD